MVGAHYTANAFMTQIYSYTATGQNTFPLFLTLLIYFFYFCIYTQCIRRQLQWRLQTVSGFTAYIALSLL